MESQHFKPNPVSEGDSSVGAKETTCKLKVQDVRPRVGNARKFDRSESSRERLRMVWIERILLVVYSQQEEVYWYVSFDNCSPFGSS